MVHSELRRGSLLSRNKEGLLSIPGYWALHLLSVGIGHQLQASASAVALEAAPPAQGGAGRRHISLRPLYSWVAQWAVVAAGLGALTTALSDSVEPVSRRACNAAYVCWMLGFNLQVCALRSSSLGAH